MPSDLLEKYDYSFPVDLIAQAPASPRDSARLLVYDRGTKQVVHDRFSHLANHLPKNAVLVFNQTKVIPARFTVIKPTGGKANLLYLRHTKKNVHALSDRKLEIGSIVQLSNQYSFRVSSRDNNWYILRPDFPVRQLTAILARYGNTPLPPYIKHTPLSRQQQRQQYQTVFAKKTGSVAAPTASLHFTTRLMNQLRKKGVTICFVTLHVGMGTFAPVTQDQLKQKKLHQEYYEIDKKTAALLNQAKRQGRPIIAVGTTAVRTLESASTNTGRLFKLKGYTTLFMQEDYSPKFVDSLITNFHVPRSSLLMLVAAFIGKSRLLAIYREAIRKKYKLFSFGDGMLVK